VTRLRLAPRVPKKTLLAVLAEIIKRQLRTVSAERSFTLQNKLRAADALAATTEKHSKIWRFIHLALQIIKTQSDVGEFSMALRHREQFILISCQFTRVNW
jgi:hypothetical protein